MSNLVLMLEGIGYLTTQSHLEALFLPSGPLYSVISILETGICVLGCALFPHSRKKALLEGTVFPTDCQQTLPIGDSRYPGVFIGGLFRGRTFLLQICSLQGKFLKISFLLIPLTRQLFLALWLMFLPLTSQS